MRQWWRNRTATNRIYLGDTRTAPAQTAVLRCAQGVFIRAASIHQRPPAVIGAGLRQSRQICVGGGSSGNIRPTPCVPGSGVSRRTDKFRGGFRPFGRRGAHTSSPTLREKPMLPADGARKSSPSWRRLGRQFSQTFEGYPPDRFHPFTNDLHMVGARLYRASRVFRYQRESAAHIQP